MAYTATTPWEYQTWNANHPWPDKYSRLAGQAITGGTYTGAINPYLTDIARGVSLIVKGSAVEATIYPYQDTLFNADFYVLGGSVQLITDAQAAILTAAGYGDYVTPAVPNVAGLTEAAAGAALVARGFIKGTVTTTTEGATPANTGKVKSQNPLADADLAQGKPVNLVIYS